MSIIDLALYSVIRQLGLDKELQPELARWFIKAANHLGVKSGGRNRNSSIRKSSGSLKRNEKEKSPKKEANKKGKSPVKEVKSEKKPQKKTGKDSGKSQLFEFFHQNGISYENIDHPEVFTVEAMLPYLTGLTGAVCKNLFLKDKKKNLYLLSAVHDKEIKLNDVAKAVGAKELRFADENVLLEKLGVTQGCVTAFALINDPEKQVKFVVDKKLVDGSYKSVNFHPLVNTATTAISCEDFKKFLSLTGHTVLEI